MYFIISSGAAPSSPLGGFGSKRAATLSASLSRPDVVCVLLIRIRRYIEPEKMLLKFI